MPTEIPPPPYQLSGIEFAQIGVLFDPVAIAPLIPPGIRLASPPAGAFYCYSAPAGWGISPYTACLVFVNVEGFDSADGSQGRALLAAFYSDRAEIALRQYLRLPVSPGGAELTTEHGTLTAYGIRDGKAVIRLVLEEPTSPPEEIRSGVHYYLGQAANGAIRIMPVAFCLHFGAAKPLSVEILSDDPDLRRLAPAALMWGGHHRNASITLGAPAQLPGEHAQLIDEEARVGVLSILSELGRPAVFMDRQGKVVFVNHAAEAILGDGLRIVGRALVSDNREDQKALDALVHKVINRKGTGRLEPL
ncbi:MAG: acetoacetate decarboxylase family protein, partial [Bauldia sp.]